MVDFSVVITGASRRLGLVLCRHFAEKGAEVYAVTRSPSDDLSSLSRVHASLHIVEISDYGAVAIGTAIDLIRSQTKTLSLLIHNASAFSPDAQRYDDAGFETFFRIHMAMPSQLTMGLSDRLYDENVPGCVVFITDIFAESPAASHSLYCSTKAGAESLARGFAKKYAPGIRVNTIQPGPIQFLPSHTDEQKQKVLGETLLPREGGFEVMVKTIDAIVDNDYMTGASIKVDGGRALGRG